MNNNYIHYYETYAGFSQDYNGNKYREPWVAYCKESGHTTSYVSGFYSTDSNCPYGTFRLVDEFQDKLKGFNIQSSEFTDIPSRLKVWECDGYLYAYNAEPTTASMTLNAVKKILVEKNGTWTGMSSSDKYKAGEYTKDHIKLEFLTGNYAVNGVIHSAAVDPQCTYNHKPGLTVWAVEAIVDDEHIDF